MAGCKRGKRMKQFNFFDGEYTGAAKLSKLTRYTQPSLSQDLINPTN